MSQIAELFVGLPGLLIAAIACLIVFERTGYNQWIGLLGVVPVLNLIPLYMLLFTTWPTQRELAILRLQTGKGDEKDGRIAYEEAIRLQGKNRWIEASDIYRMVESRFSGTDMAKDAAISRGQCEARA